MTRAECQYIHQPGVVCEHCGSGEANNGFHGEPTNGNGKPRIVAPNEPSQRAMRRPINRAEAVEFMSTAVLAMGQKIYDEIAEEHAKVFAQQQAEFAKVLEERDKRLAAIEEHLYEAHGITFAPPPIQWSEKQDPDDFNRQ